MEGAAVYQDKLKRLAELVKYQLDPEKFPRIKYSDDVRVPVNTLQLLIKKINEEYVVNRIGRETLRRYRITRENAPGW